MKAVLMSIHPKWCEKIFNGENTIEVRKTVPKLETPFTVYVYQTKTRNAGNAFANHWSDCLELPNGEFVNAGGKVIGSFVCDRIRKIIPLGLRGFKLGAECLKEMCLSKEQLDKYGGLKTLYGWHITEPKLFDKPRELSEFSKFGFKDAGGCCINYKCHNFIDNGWMQPPECKIDGCFLTRAPQSWFYCETIDEK